MNVAAADVLSFIRSSGETPKCPFERSVAALGEQLEHLLL